MTTKEEGRVFSLSPSPGEKYSKMGSTSNNMHVKDDDQALAVLATEAGVLKLDEVGNTILLVKPGDSIKEVMKNLTTASSEVLSRTYAFLMNLKEDDDDVTKFVKDGWAQMIFYRLKQLMPIGCKKCNQVYKNERQEVARVSCRVCGIGACKDCYPAEEALGKWFFLCGSCDKTIGSMMGEEALEAKHFRKKKAGKEKAVSATQEESESEKGDEQDKNVEEEKEKEEVIEIEEDFEEVKNNKRGFKGNKKTSKPESNEKEKDVEKTIPICYHFKKARCRHGLSGKQSYNGVPKCPFRHPMICQRLLRNGDRGKGGCKGKEQGCNDFHNVKMCFNSMNQKKCSNPKDCPNGYHIKGTVVVKEGHFAKASVKEKEDFPPLEKSAKTPKHHQSKPQEKEQEAELSQNSQFSSFLGQLLQQQQEMRQEQQQMQQQMMHLMSRMAGTSPESRPTSPMMGMMNMPANLITQGFRVGG